MRLVLFVLLGFVAAGYAKFCGRDEAPTRLEIQSNGAVELICAPQQCNIAGNTQMHSCYHHQSSCPNSNEWVGGAVANPSKFVMSCCKSPYLTYARTLGTTILYPEDIFAGGAWKSASESGFDAITDIQRVGSNSTGNVAYRITVSRITCPKSADLVAASPTFQRADVAGNLQGVLGLGGPFWGQPQIVDDEQEGALLPPPPQSAGNFFPQFPQLAQLPGQSNLCFSEDQIVTTPEGQKMMKDIKIGDRVLTAEAGRLSFSPVESWLHRYPDKEFNFLNMRMEDGSELTLTPDHYIYHVPCDSVDDQWSLSFAKEVVPGKDCVINVTPSAHPVPVVSVEPVMAKGAYGPMTANSNIVVNDLAASCYAVVKDGILLNSLLGITQAFDNMCQSAAELFGYNSGNNGLNEMPTSLNTLLGYANMIFPDNWKMMG